MYPLVYGSIVPPRERWIERPGIVIHMTLAEYLHLADHPEIEREWQRRLALDRLQRIDLHAG
jgi:hypothetical protein